jgi:hypothetical protein
MMSVWLAWTLGCSGNTPAGPSCAEPHVYYAPDNSGDLYFGCAPPEGWVLTAPGEPEPRDPTAALPVPPVAATPPLPRPPPLVEDVPPTGDTGGYEEEVVEPPSPETGDDTGGAEEGDSAAPDGSGDTGLPEGGEGLEGPPDTGVVPEGEPDFDPETGDTGLVP